MKNQDIIDILFEKKESEDLFCIDKEALSNLNKKIEELGKKIRHYLVKEHKYPLESLLIEKEKLLFEYAYEESRMMYRNGISDGVTFILNSLKNKK